MPKLEVTSIGTSQTLLTIERPESRVEILFSYKTPVACHVQGKGYFKTTEKFSNTTSKHITQYLDGNNAEYRSQEWFDSLLTLDK